MGGSFTRSKVLGDGGSIGQKFNKANGGSSGQGKKMLKDEAKKIALENLSLQELLQLLQKKASSNPSPQSTKPQNAGQQTQPSQANTAAGQEQQASQANNAGQEGGDDDDDGGDD